MQASWRGSRGVSGRGRRSRTSACKWLTFACLSVPPPLDPLCTEGSSMQHLGDLLAALPLPAAGTAVTPPSAETALVHDLGADLPAGHLHVWGGPSGAGK